MRLLFPQYEITNKISRVIGRNHRPLFTAKARPDSPFTAPYCLAFLILLKTKAHCVFAIKIPISRWFFEKIASQSSIGVNYSWLLEKIIMQIM